MTGTVVAVALAWVMVALGCWLGYQLLRQNGRILLRLEALEDQVAQLLPPGFPAGLPVGETAPQFELLNLAGGRTALSQFRGLRVLLVFFDPQCRFCQDMAPQLAALPSEGADDKPVPLVVSIGEAEDNRRLVRKHGIRCPVLLQEQMDVAFKYRAEGTPTGYLIDEEGRIASELMVGAEALLTLARTPGSDASDSGEHGAVGNGGGHRVHKGNRPLSTSRINRTGLKAGTPAPIFRLPRLDGSELSLENYRGRRVLLVFSDPECGPCDELAPKLEELSHRMPEVRILMVGRRDPAITREKVAKFGLTYPVVLQRHWEISRLYSVFVTPAGYLIDEQGMIAADVAVGVEPILTLLSNVRAGVAAAPATQSMA